MKNEVKPEIEIEMVCLINVKNLNIDDAELNPQTMTIRKDLYEKHLKIKAGYLNDYVLAEDQSGNALKVIEDSKPIEKIVPIENNDLKPKEDPEKPAQDPEFNDPSNDFEPFVLKPLESFVDNSDHKIDFGENLIPKQDPEKPIKKNKQKIKAH